MDLGSEESPADPLWLGPCPAELYYSPEQSPAEQYESRQSVVLAFLVAIQHLPARQRAALLLRDVLGFQATECAELLELSVPAVNSALQRARATLASRSNTTATPASLSAEHSALLQRYVQAWERADVKALIALLLKDATLAMPPLSQWLAGAEAIGGAIQEMLFAPAGPGAFRLLTTEANGQPAFGAYQVDLETGEPRPMSLHVLELRDGRVASITAFLDPSLLAKFGLPDTLPA